MSGDVLERICADKKEHVAACMAKLPLKKLKVISEEVLATRGFINKIRNQKSHPALIAEIKKASPSKGLIRAEFNPAELARTYAENGATCLSVLTDVPYFQGCDDDLRAARAAVDLPILRKDFMIDPYQVYEARAMGADCILLIMAALEDSQAADLYALANELALDTLFEVHHEAELERALALKPRMVGVNNRNLKTLEVDIATGMNLAGSIPNDVVAVAESGIADYETVMTFQAAGYSAFLIGESLMRAEDLGAATRKILNLTN